MSLAINPEDIADELILSVYKQMVDNHGLSTAPFLFVYWLQAEPQNQNLRCQVLAEHLEHAFARSQAEHFIFGNTPDSLWHDETLALLGQLGQIRSLNRTGY